MPQIEFASERWEDFWPDASGLMQEGFDEYAGVLGLWKPHRPDTGLLEALVASGRLVVMTARVNGAIGAYLMWVVDADAESAGHTLYRQGPFLAAAKWAKLGLGARLLRKSLGLIRSNITEPVEVALHHPPVGRGAALGGFYEALGAVKASVNYRLKVLPKPQEPINA